MEGVSRMATTEDEWTLNITIVTEKKKENGVVWRSFNQWTRPELSHFFFLIVFLPFSLVPRLWFALLYLFSSFFFSFQAFYTWRQDYTVLLFSRLFFVSLYSFSSSCLPTGLQFFSFLLCFSSFFYSFSSFPCVWMSHLLSFFFLFMPFSRSFLLCFPLSFYLFLTFSS